MPSRRPHHKTRRGCTGCKKRRIKCDEHTPECHNCTKKSLSCSLLTLVPTSRLSSSSSSPTPVPQSQAVAKYVHVFNLRSPSPLPDISSLSSLTATLESRFPDSSKFFHSKGREILHHFLTNTSATLATHSPTQRIWQVNIPQIATTHPYLVHGILAATSLHLSELHEVPEAKETFFNIALSQLDTSLSHYRKEISNITAENCDALFAFSTLTVVFTFRTAREDAAKLIASAHEDGVDASRIAAQLTSIVCGVLSAARGGAQVILSPSWSWIMKGPLAQICEREWWPKDRTPRNPQSVEEDHRLHQLECIWMIPGQPYDDTHGIFAAALRSLRDTFALVSQLTDDSNVDHHSSLQHRTASANSATGTLIDRGAVFTWPVSVSQEFVALVEQQHPAAFALLAHWAILLHRVRDLWFIDGLATGIIAAAAFNLGTERQSWIEWPLQEVGLELPDGIRY